MVFAVMLISLAAATGVAPDPVTRTYCGVRSGTAGNAFLDAARARDSLTLAEQGGSQELLDEIDALVAPYRGETGTQNGLRYCAVVRIDRKGQPAKVVKAWRQ